MCIALMRRTPGPDHSGGDIWLPLTGSCQNLNRVRPGPEPGPARAL